MGIPRRRFPFKLLVRITFGPEDPADPLAVFGVKLMVNFGMLLLNTKIPVGIECLPGHLGGTDALPSMRR